MRPILAMRPFLIPPSLRKRGARVPSTTMPFLMTMSNSAMTRTSRELRQRLRLVCLISTPLCRKYKPVGMLNFPRRRQCHRARLGNSLECEGVLGKVPDKSRKNSFPRVCYQDRAPIVGRHESMEALHRRIRTMAKPGRLTLSNTGYSMPADAPAYQRPPFYYRGTRSIAVAFETDADAALGALPAQLAISEPATAVLSFYHYPWTTFGPYNETILSLLVEHNGCPMTYIAHIAVTSEPPMLAGREIWGFPKKLAQIEFKQERDMIYGTLERPAGIRLASAVVRPERPADNGHSGAARS